MLIAGAAMAFVLGGLTFAFAPGAHVAGAGSDLGYRPPAPIARTRALWFGDSYTEGAGAAAPGSTGYVDLISQHFHWFYAADAQGGTGFINNGHDNVKTNQPMIDRLRSDRRLSGSNVDLLVVDGGRDDGALRPALIERAASTYFDALHRYWPNATVLVLAPFYLRDPSSAFAPFRQWEKDQARKRGWYFIDPIAEGWISPANPRSYLYKDHIHPNQAGYDFITRHLIADIGKSGLLAATPRTVYGAPAA